MGAPAQIVVPWESLGLGHQTILELRQSPPSP